MTNKQLNERIRNMAKDSQIPYPENYDVFICKVLEELPEEPEEVDRRSWWKRKHNWSPAPAILLGILIIVAAGASVGAVVHGYLRQMEKMSEEKRKEYVAYIEDTEKNGDYYSRDFTKEEQKRGKKLAEKYKEGKIYPQKELPVFESEISVSEYSVYFMKRNSTFHLSEKELTDEELLEIIDFYFKREYSLTEKIEDKERENSTEKKEDLHAKISKKEAIDMAEHYIREIYGVDVRKWERQVEHYVPKHSKNKYTYVYYSTKKSPLKYSVEIERMKKGINVLTADSGEGIAGKGVKEISKKEIEDIFKEGLDIVKKLQSTLTIQQFQCKYMKKISNHMIDDVIEFVYIQDGQKGYVLNYSLQKKMFIMISKMDDYAEYTKEYQSRADKKKCKVLTLELKESNVAEKEAN